jgi:hypothetical protein
MKTRTFEYLLNAFEHASQSKTPAENGYADKRSALFSYVAALQSTVTEASEPPTDPVTDFRQALDRAAYALFQIKRMVPEEIPKFAANEHSAACAVLDCEQPFKRSE